jgi:hypothetical protein
MNRKSSTSAEEETNAQHRDPILPEKHGAPIITLAPFGQRGLPGGDA